MMGGAQLMIKANEGLDPDVGRNTLQFRVDDYGDDFTLSGPGLNRDDEFFSNPSQGKLAFTAPSVMDLYGFPFDAFNGATDFPPDGHD